MLSNYLKITLRNLNKNKAYTFINIGGFAIGMSVTILMGIWILNELSFNKVHTHYDRVGRLMHHVNFNGERVSLIYMPYQIGEELENKYGKDFDRIVMSTLESEHVLTHTDDRKFKIVGSFMDADAPDLLSLKMIKGSKEGLQDISSVFLAGSVAHSIFGDTDPMGKFLQINSQLKVQVTGVYKDFDDNSDFERLKFIAPWQLFLNNDATTKSHSNPWQYNNFQTFIQVSENSDFGIVSEKIGGLINEKLSPDEADLYQKQVFIHPMSKWHLYSEFKNGLNTGGRIQYIKLFSTIGLFVLLMACINFMNLSTARSEKRAKEVGIRKAMGSVKFQLVFQFFLEAFFISFIAFLLALPIVYFILPFFNEISEKSMELPWSDLYFWVIGVVFSLATGIVAGSYPAFYLSSFQPASVLKGAFKAGKRTSLPRKVLVVLQFTISLVLIIGTIVVFRQIHFAKSKPVGYTMDYLITFNTTNQIHQTFDAFRNELIRTQVVEEVTESANSTTDYYVSDGAIDWEGKDPDMALEFPINNVTPEYGKTIGWKIIEGRDFSREFPSDKMAFILNETAVKFMGLKEPIGSIVEWRGRPFHVIGVIEDIVFESPYQPVRPSIFQMTGDRSYLITARINPEYGNTEALARIKSVFQKYDPAVPFDFQFVNQEFNEKFKYEERVGKLASFFAVLAILISSLGIFGLAAFMAEQRVKEIGIRKVLGSSVFNLWMLLSKDFALLVIMALIIALPLAYFLMSSWLQNYHYRSGLPFWVFLVAAIGAMTITLLTISYHCTKAALLNPIKSLRSE
ncbi:FtsX-like permease family protein [Fulvivirga sp. M361]|uniref:ABC transporter permease n=1 Tax=Fulvivirga sp. M361 TaxID=2594266 RepID=UPI00117AAA60|nr:ABC transporter permease [Fulvivirga sp. M361]TRX60209.1 FtsX-like permease family protein [Fulvivirga sp. M361]